MALKTKDEEKVSTKKQLERENSKLHKAIAQLKKDVELKKEVLKLINQSKRVEELLQASNGAIDEPEAGYYAYDLDFLDIKFTENQIAMINLSKAQYGPSGESLGKVSNLADTLLKVTFGDMSWAGMNLTKMKELHPQKTKFVITQLTKIFKEGFQMKVFAQLLLNKSFFAKNK